MTRVEETHLPLVRALRGESTRDFELFISNVRVPDGVYISVNAEPLRDPKGVLAGGVAVFRDVTRQVQTRDALARAFAAGRIEIIETVLHNIGNAINSVAVGVDTMHDRLRENELASRFTALADTVTAHQDDWLRWLSHDPQGRAAGPFLIAIARDMAVHNEQMLRTASRVRGRVQHIINIIRTQRSPTGGTVERQIVRLRPMIRDTLRMLAEALDKHGIKTKIDCARAPDEIWIQESAFHQMLVNLIKNAVEAIGERASKMLAAQAPHIHILAYAQEQFLVVDVIDNGIGIPQEMVETVFRRRLFDEDVGDWDSDSTRPRSFISEIGGSIEAFSEGIGRGTTIRVKLRLSDLARGSSSAEKPPAPDSG